MKKKLLIIMMVTMMASLSIACGNGQKESLEGAASVEVSEETMEEDEVEATEETMETDAAEVTEETMEAVEENTVSTEDANSENDVEVVEENVAKSKQDMFEEMYGALFYGIDEAGNSYYFMVNGENTNAAFVIVSENGEISLKMVGDSSCDCEDVYSYTINDENGENFSFIAEVVPEGLLITLEDGRSVLTRQALEPEQVDEAMDYVIIEK